MGISWTHLLQCERERDPGELAVRRNRGRSSFPPATGRLSRTAYYPSMAVLDRRAGLAPFALVVLACSSDPARPEVIATADAGISEGPLIEVKTTTPGSSLAPAEPTNATWAAIRDVDG